GHPALRINPDFSGMGHPIDDFPSIIHAMPANVNTPGIFDRNWARILNSCTERQFSLRKLAGGWFFNYN
ncbi:MAG: hypothetical protein ACI4AL_09655, partial [Aristaeellaceae bacterium]